MSGCRIVLLLSIAVKLVAADSATDAYKALQWKEYDRAVAAFRRAVEMEPNRAELRKELAYTLLKMGETEEARDVFAEIIKLVPTDWHSTLEYGYLCHETRLVAEARRAFDRVRKLGDIDSKKTADQAYGNIDLPLQQAIQRWTEALRQNPHDFSAHVELARAAEQREDGVLASQHFQRAWELKPTERTLLVELGRSRKIAGDVEGANAAWLAASRSAIARAAELGRELLPKRTPYASEFQKAIALDRANVELRRELGFLWLAVSKATEAEAEFQKLLEVAPDDMLTLAQLGLMRLGRNDVDGAMKLLDKVLNGKDEALAKKVRDALATKSGLKPRAVATPVLQNKTMGDKSYASGFMNDAARFYRAAKEDNPDDPEVDLRLGRTYNMLRQDDEAIRFFDLARKNGDGDVKREAESAYRNLRPSMARLRTTAWLYPMFSSRWHEAFSYGQMKAELRIGNLPFRPYATVRFVGDSNRAGGGLTPQYLSESSFIVGIGVATKQWEGLMGWAEAGNAMRYRERTDVGRMIPDYRGGLNYSRSYGAGIGAEQPGWFFQFSNDLVTLSRFRWDTLVYSQNRVGYTMPRFGPLQWQLTWVANFTADRNREAWANFVDQGPGVRFRWKRMPPSMLWTVDLLRGNYLIHEGNPRKPVYYDVRAGVWYAITH